MERGSLRCAVTLEALEKLKTGHLRGIADQIRSDQIRSDASILTAGVSNEWQARSSIRIAREPFSGAARSARDYDRLSRIQPAWP
jgi:hypothetical protein